MPATRMRLMKPNDVTSGNVGEAEFRNSERISCLSVCQFAFPVGTVDSYIYTPSLLLRRFCHQTFLTHCFPFEGQGKKTQLN